MTKNDSNSGPEPPAQSDPLSATAMFLKAFETEPEGAKKSPDPFFSEPAAPKASAPANLGAAPPAFNDTPFKPAAPGAGPGEFTQMFNSLGPRQTPFPEPARETPQPAQGATAVVKGPPQPPSDPAAGEVTRIFVSGSTPPWSPSARPSEETRPVRSSSPSSRSKGFSSPGASDSASAEGSFTQFFSTSPSSQSSRPTAPVQPSAPPPPPAADSSWKDDPFFRAAARPSSPEPPSPSVTGILSNLASSGSPPSASRHAEPVPYRPEPSLPSYAPPKPAGPTGAEQGGVTQILERLSKVTSAAAPPPPPPPAVPPQSSGPGEFTRMISAIGTGPVATGSAAPPSAQPAAAPAPPFTPVAPPPVPAVAPPTVAPPKVAMPHAPAPAAPPPAPAIPAPPKIAPPPAPALAPPKSKLEAMVPILLVINTFLLVLLLVVVIFLIKAK